MHNETYIKRDITDSVLAGAKDSPVVSIIGPRQSGKSTLCRHIFPFFDNLNWLKQELKLENNGALIYSGDQSQKRTHNSVFSWNNCYKVIDLV